MEKSLPRNQSSQLTFLFLLTVVILSSFLIHGVFFMYSTLLEEGRGTLDIIRSGRRLISNYKTMRSPTAQEKLPFCLGKLLDQRQYRYANKEGDGSYDDSIIRFMTESGSCRLLNYTSERIARCFDALRNQRPPESPYRMIFMGDSIIRQHYLNFVRLIPDYDKILEPSNAALLFQGDMEVTSVSLGLWLSFRWQPFVNDVVVNKVRQWTNPNNTTRRPFFVLLGMAVWHMFDANHRDTRRYLNNVRQLTPALAQLSKFTRVIWLNQYPAVHFYSDNNAPSTYVSSEKLNNYNKAVRRILLLLSAENDTDSRSRVEIWDSGNPLVEEYVRSCEIFRRYEKKKTSPGLLTLKYYSGAYRNCRSDVHAGYSALSQITQLLYNDICSPSQI